MSLTQITRDNQIKPGSAYNWITNDSSGKLSEVLITASRAIASDANGLPTASVSTAAQLAFLQDLTGLTVGDIIKVSSGGNLQDAGIAAANLFLANGTVNATANLNIGGFKITNLADPTSAQDAATKNYVDGLVNGVSWKMACRLGSVVTIPGFVAGTITIPNANATYFPNAGAAAVIDDQTIAVNDRILVKNQSTPAENGIYKVTVVGVQGTTDAVLVRATDMDTWIEVPAATAIIEMGTVNADQAYVCTSDLGGTLNTTAITWALFGTVNTYSAGSGLDLAGNVFSISTDNSLTANAGNSNPSLVVKEDPTGAIVTGASGIAVNLETSNPTLQISTNKLGVKLDGSRAITTGASGIGVNVDNSTIDISTNAIEVKAGGITNTQVSASAAIVASKLVAAGSDTQVQFNDSTAFAGNSKLTFNKTTGDLTLGDNQYLVFGNSGNAKMKYDAVNANFYIQQNSGLVSDSCQIAAPGDFAILANGVGDFIPNFQLLAGGSAQLNAHSSITFSNDAGAASLNSTGYFQVNNSLIVGSGAPAASSIVKFNSTTKGFLEPVLTTTQRDAIGTPAEGLQVYNTTTKLLDWYDGTAWKEVGTYSASSFVTREVPSGTINGSNVTFTLANTPTVGTECVFLNGLLQNVGGGNDYTISGGTITFVTAPETASVILVNYQK